jgi:glutamyl-tRNA reductase
MTKIPGLPEGMILSTCNRVELYAAAKSADAATAALGEWLCSLHGVSPKELEGRLYSHAGVKALRHIFRVVSSLDSMVIGEPQIVAQVKEAYQLALGKQAAGPMLNRVLHKAFSVAKRVRTETGIAAHAVSVSYAAVELARKIFGELAGKSVLLVGAGEMGELAAKHLQKNGASEILVANRTWERAVELAGAFQGTPLPFDKLPAWLSRADIVVCAAAAPGYLVTKAMVQEAIHTRRHRPIFLIDIAVPRIVDPAAGGLGDVYLYGIDDLRHVVDVNLAERRKEAAKAEVIVDAEAAEFAVALSKVELGPTIGLLNSKLESLRKGEIGRLGATLSPNERDIADRVTKALTAKFAHETIAALKDGLLDADTLRRIFNLAVEEVLPLEEIDGEKEKKGSS